MEEKDRLAGLYADIFERDPRGAAIYEDLYRRFGANAKVHTDGGIDAILKTYQDAAERGVIEYIVRMVNIGNGLPDLQPDDQGDDDVSTL